MKQKSWILLLLFYFPSTKAKKVMHQPHILLIVGDDLGYNDVPWHNPTIISPHLEYLARGGVILEQNYVQTKCSPSRSALLTGELLSVSAIYYQYYSLHRSVPFPHWAPA